jgi:4-methyl-5(b-hydroxyethyl)-thiazole monophosphate biosynthesis
MKYCIILGNNFEDVEAVTQIDILRRAGVNLDIYGVGSDTMRSRSNVIYKTEKVFTGEDSIDINQYEGILLPGGPGTSELAKNEALVRTVREFFDAGKLVFAICAAPVILEKAGILKDKNFTCFPGSASEIHSGRRLDERVVEDGNIITSQGLGTSLDAAIRLVERIVSKEEAAKQEQKVLYHK